MSFAAAAQVHVPEGLTGLDLDLIKLTAQFVARNGAAFLTGLTQRESNNPAFYFLKPTHSMFGFFTSLADAYSAVLMPDKGLKEQLAHDAGDRWAEGGREGRGREGRGREGGEGRGTQEAGWAQDSTAQRCNR